MRKNARGKRWMFDLRTEMKTLTNVADRLAFLKRWAATRRKRKDPRSHEELRAAFRRGNPRGRSLLGKCWCCWLEADVFTHHILQLQHGGTNNRLNFVRICGRCHAEVHPWLKKETVEKC